MSKETIVIPKKEYDQLVKDSEFLRALEAAGVDNWDGHSFALEALENQT